MERICIFFSTSHVIVFCCGILLIRCLDPLSAPQYPHLHTHRQNVPGEGASSMPSSATDPVSSSSMQPASTPSSGGGPKREPQDGLSFQDAEGLFHSVKHLMDGPFPVPDLDTFVGLGSAVAENLDAGAYAEVLENMESGRTFGNIITQGTLHFAPARDPAVGCVELLMSSGDVNRDNVGVVSLRRSFASDALPYGVTEGEESTPKSNMFATTQHCFRAGRPPMNCKNHTT